MTVSRRKFLNGLSLVAGSAILLPDFFQKMGIEYKTLTKENTKSRLAGVYLAPGVGGSLFDSYVQFVENLNLFFNDTHFFISSDPATAQIKITSPSLDQQSTMAMLFLNRSPGGLNKSDFKKWLDSSTAKNIWNSAYADKGYKPFYLSLGPEKHHQAVSMVFEEKANSKSLLFGSSIANSWRSAIKEFKVIAVPTPLKAQQKLRSGEIISIEALQPRIANLLKADGELIFLEDGLSSTPALYQLLVADDFWNFLQPTQKDFLVNLIGQFSTQLDLHMTSEEKKYDCNLLAENQIQTLPSSILKMRQLEYNFSKELLLRHSLKAGMKNLYEEYESFRTMPLKKLILS